ncbi:MAG: hypothetical protein IT380_26700 [Myxococcales bacterium]|nr:hypothetical protein [Myxococcales bacterium]
MACPMDQLEILSRLGVVLLDGLELRIDVDALTITFTAPVHVSCVKTVLAELPGAERMDPDTWLVHQVKVDSATLDELLAGQLEPSELFSAGGATLLILAQAEFPALVGEATTIGIETIVSLGVLSERSAQGLADALSRTEATLVVFPSAEADPVFYTSPLGQLPRRLNELLEDAAGFRDRPIFALPGQQAGGGLPS